MVHQQPRRITRRDAGLTLIGSIVAFTVLLILSTMALPLMTVRVQREKERRCAWRLKRFATRSIATKMRPTKDCRRAGPDNHGYPESLDILVEGVEVNQNPA
ncbi:MAG: hypothetical protein R2724_32630 [Bryobacterales bacterium]